MPLMERRMRWEAMMAKLRTGTIQQWFADFTDTLWDSRLERDPSGSEVAEPAALRPLRSITQGGVRYH
jgi:trehalose 6-phosphate synthase